MTESNKDEAALWLTLRQEASAALEQQPQLAALLTRTVLQQDSLGSALIQRLAQQLANNDLDVGQWETMLREPLQSAAMQAVVSADMLAYRARDPACISLLQPLLFFKGFAAVQTQRAAHAFWQQGRHTLAWLLQSRASELWQVDIHPAAKLGAGLFLDHATGVVIGETAVVGENVTIMHGVTMGGNGKERGDRHPKIGDGVLLSVGAKVLGNIQVGEGARVAAGAVVLHNVPPHVTVAGAPARPVGQAAGAPALSLDHCFDI